MNAWTQPSSRTIAIMIALLIIRGGGKLGCKFCDAEVVIWVKIVVVGEVFLVVLRAPDVEEDSAAFGYEFPVDPVI